MQDEGSTMLEMAPGGIFSFTEEGIIVTANSYAHKILGFEAGELNGLNIAALLTISGRIFYQTHFYPLVKLHKHAEEIFLNLQSKTKTDTPVVLNAISLADNDRQLILCSFIAVVNRRKYEDEILLAKKTAEDAIKQNQVLETMKDELQRHQQYLDKQLSLLRFQHLELLQVNDIITHDLQEPLRKLMLFSNELQLERTAAVKDRALKVIHRSSARIKNIPHNLQIYLGLSETVALTDHVALGELLHFELQALQREYPSIEVHANIEDPLPIIKGNRHQLGKLFYYLLQNAFEHGVSGTNLVLQVHAVILKENIFNSLDDRYKYVDFVKLTFQDKGPGFESRFNDYIFGVLKRLDMTANRSGFGLAFCKRIAENHYGSIRADGVPGKGATFTVMLPIDHVF